MRKFIYGYLLFLLLMLPTLSALACEHVEEDGVQPIPGGQYKPPTDMERGYFPPMVCPICSEEIESGYEIASIHEQECQNSILNGKGHISLVSDPELPPACETPGMTAGMHCEYCGEVTQEREIIPAKGHEWGNPAYTWAEDYSRVTGTISCGNDPGHREEETVNTTSSVIIPATYEAPGRMEYTAVFSNPLFSVQQAETVIPRLEEITGPYADGTGNYNIRPDGTAIYTGPVNNRADAAIPDTVAVNGKQVPVTAIAEKAFKQNKKLKTVTIGKNVKILGKSAFASCIKLETVRGGAAVKEIRDSVFSGCKALKTLPALGRLQAIGTGAFKGCVKLKKITLGTEIKSIGKNAFNGCKALKSITVKTKKLTASKVGAGAFKNIHQKAVIRCPKTKRKAYEKLFLKKGAPKTCVFK